MILRMGNWKQVFVVARLLMFVAFIAAGVAIAFIEPGGEHYQPIIIGLTLLSGFSIAQLTEKLFSTEDRSEKAQRTVEQRGAEIEREVARSVTNENELAELGKRQHAEYVVVSRQVTGSDSGAK